MWFLNFKKGINQKGPHNLGGGAFSKIMGGYPQFEMWILEIFTSSGQNITSRGAASRGDI